MMVKRKSHTKCKVYLRYANDQTISFPLSRFNIFNTSNISNTSNTSNISNISNISNTSNIPSAQIYRLSIKLSNKDNQKNIDN